MNIIKVKIVGEGPLMLHNRRLANPLDEYTKAKKALTDKKTKKTEADLLEILELEFRGSLYFKEGTGPYIPGAYMRSHLADVAKMKRRYKQVLRGLFVQEDICPLEYKGPKDMDGLWAAKEFVDIRPVPQGPSVVTRCRPIFHPPWSFVVTLAYHDSILDQREILEYLTFGGSIHGFAEGRPQYGRYSFKVLHEGRL